MDIKNKVRVAPFLGMLIPTFILNFLFFNEQIYNRINGVLAQNDIISIQYLMLAICCLALFIFSFNLINWSLSPKHIKKLGKISIFIHWLVTFLSLIISIFLYLNIYLNYKPTLTLSKITIAPILTSILLALGAISIWGSLYKWVSPAISKLDYTRLQYSLYRFQDIFRSYSGDNNYDDLKARSITGEIEIILDVIKSEVLINSLYENSYSEREILAELKLNSEILMNDFIKIVIQSKSYSDIGYLYKESEGGNVTNEVIRAKQYILSI